MNKDRNIILLSGAFIASLVIANLLGSKLIVIYGVTVSVGVFFIPVTFLATDLLSELYGKKVASTTVFVGLIIQVYVLIAIWIGDIFPAAQRRDLTEAYRQMFSLAPRMVLASIVAYTCSQFIDVRIYHFFKNLTKGKYLWLRNNASTMTSQLIDTFVFISIFLGGILETRELIKTFLALYAVKIAMAAIDTPFMYLGKHLLEEKSQDETVSTGSKSS